MNMFVLFLPPPSAYSLMSLLQTVCSCFVRPQRP